MYPPVEILLPSNLAVMTASPCPPGLSGATVERGAAGSGETGRIFGIGGEIHP
ncbi:hypothetical protein [Thermodesulfitimonas autotrophica]|uniref:hypothetical protein n=1 Tax=Thermodesulfitimonas autotrophica TaxID=1894989 RepID=UPI002FE1913E